MSTTITTVSVTQNTTDLVLNIFVGIDCVDSIVILQSHLKSAFLTLKQLHQ